MSVTLYQRVVCDPEAVIAHRGPSPFATVARDSPGVKRVTGKRREAYARSLADGPELLPLRRARSRAWAGIGVSSGHVVRMTKPNRPGVGTTGSCTGA